LSPVGEVHRRWRCDQVREDVGYGIDPAVYRTSEIDDYHSSDDEDFTGWQEMPRHGIPTRLSDFYNSAGEGTTLHIRGMAGRRSLTGGPPVHINGIHVSESDVSEEDASEDPGEWAKQKARELLAQWTKFV
jgi:hypothetical protein